MEKENKGWKAEICEASKVRAYANLIADTYALADSLPESEENDRKYLLGVAVMLGEILQEKIEK